MTGDGRCFSVVAALALVSQVFVAAGKHVDGGRSRPALAAGRPSMASGQNYDASFLVSIDARSRQLYRSPITRRRSRASASAAGTPPETAATESATIPPPLPTASLLAVSA